MRSVSPLEIRRKVPNPATTAVAGVARCTSMAEGLAYSRSVMSASRRVLLLLLHLASVLLAACGTEYDDRFEGVMSDRSYGDQLTADGCRLRPDGRGEPTCIDRFAGRFVWADYAAPWCPPCVDQVPALKQLDAELGEEVVFLTVMTSVTPGYRSIPAAATAAGWAERFDLDPTRVVAADNLWGMTIPTHILYSPTGQSLYRSTGYLPAAAMREILERRIADWRRWQATGDRADWMR